jgi:hypothetical protein
MPGAERDCEGDLRDVSIEWVAVGLIAVAQQHDEQKDNKMLYVSRELSTQTGITNDFSLPGNILLPAWESKIP